MRKGLGSPREVTQMSSRSFSVSRGRSDVAALYGRVAATLELSAQLAEQHAKRERTKGRSDATEVASAKRAHEAARRARDLASQS